jgi:Uma2 family endonuclease
VPTAVSTPATLDDLAKVDGKAELIGGRIVPIMPTGRVPGRLAKRILRSLDDYERQGRRGESFGDNVGYAIRPPLPNGRESFSPDVSYYVGSSPYHDAGFIDGPPTFAVEVRSEHDFGPAKDQEYADKRADYFAAGTQVVWDVDYQAETVTSYRHTDPATPVVFRHGDTADAEPAVPGWGLKVDDIFG